MNHKKIAKYFIIFGVIVVLIVQLVALNAKVKDGGSLTRMIFTKPLWVYLNAKVKDGGSLTDEEKMVAMNATKKIGKIRKDYSKGKLVAPAPPPPTPTTKMAWVLRINGNFNRQSSEAVEIDGKEKFLITDKEIMFSYKDGKGGQAVWLTREKTGNFYHGVFALRDKTKQELFLLENGEMFSGYIQQVNGNGKSKKALLRKEEVMIK